MKYPVSVLAEPGLGKYRPGLAGAARAALSHQQAEPGSLTVLLAGITRMQQLNAEFAGVDRATDVLSFPADDQGLDVGGRYYGDIAVCVPVAQAQAARKRHDLAGEGQLLVVHGVLHLLGYDHDTPARKRQMWRAQKEILTALRSGTDPRHAST